MSKFIENSYFSILGNIINLSISILSGMIIAKTLGPEGKGTYFLVSQVVTIGAVFFSLGFGPSILYYLKKERMTKNEAISFSLFYSLFVVLILFLLFLLFKNTLIESFNNSITDQMLLFTFLLIIVNILTNFFGYIIMDNEIGVKIWSFVGIIVNVVYIILLFFLVYEFSNGVIGAIYALFISVLVRLLISLKYVFSERFALQIISFEMAKKMLKYGLGIFIGNLFLTGVYRIDIFFVNNILSVEELGLYSVSVNLSELLLLVPSAVGIALFPYLSSLGKKDQILIMSKVARLSTFLSVLASLGIMVFAYPFILIVFGKEFIPSFTPTLFLLPGLVAMTLNFAYSNYLFSIGKPFMSAKIFLVGILVNIFFNILFLKAFGIIGAAIFSSVTYCIITIGFIITILKENKGIKFKEIIIPTKEDYNYIIIKLKNILKLN